MSENNFHKNSLTFKTPPKKKASPSVIIKEKETYQNWLAIYRDFPRIERFGLGKKIDWLFLEVLELSFTACYLPPEQKIVALGKIISKLDVLKFFLQLSWEYKLVHTERYTNLSQKLEEIGRMLGGWKKGLQTKTPTRNG